MSAGLDKAAFDALYEKSGLRLTDAQKSVLHEVYPLLRAMIAHATKPLPREAEPALIFRHEVR